MKEKVAVKEREKWVDNVKIIACILVALGHFFQSMVKSGILSDGSVYGWFNTTIYYFHVPLFFICSGYLYQKYSKVNNVADWRKNITKKALALGVPYVTFSTATWVLKNIFSSSVNDRLGGLGETLLLHPASPYWYLYALFFVFLITPTFADKGTAEIGLVIALVAKFLTLLGDDIYVVYTVFSNEIWFVLGMCICAFNVPLKGKKCLGIGLGLVFLILSIAVCAVSVNNMMISFLLGLLACVAVILLAADAEGKWDALAQYTMPVFLMHTLFAASLRAVLLKVGITNAVIHVLLGLSVSFVGPIIAAWIMKKTKWLEFFLYPNKFVRKTI